MRCVNCGAQMDENTLICPYCGTENEAEAREQHRETLNAIYDKIEHLDGLEDEVVKKANRSVGKLAIFLIVLLSAGFVLIYIISRIIASNALSSQEKQLQKLEEYYQAGDYQAVADYYKKLDTDSASFGKYEQTEKACRFLEHATFYFGDEVQCFNFLPEGDTQEYLSFRDSIADNITFDLNNIFYSLFMLEQMEAEGYIYGEQAAVEYCKTEIMNVLKQSYLLEDREIAEAVPLQEDDDLDRTVYQELALQVADRIWEHRQDDIKEARKALFQE